MCETFRNLHWGDHCYESTAQRYIFADILFIDPFDSFAFTPAADRNLETLYTKLWMCCVCVRVFFLAIFHSLKNDEIFYFVLLLFAREILSNLLFACTHAHYYSQIKHTYTVYNQYTHILHRREREIFANLDFWWNRLFPLFISIIILALFKYAHESR